MYKKIILIGVIDDISVQVYAPKYLGALHLDNLGVQTHTLLSSIVP